MNNQLFHGTRDRFVYSLMTQDFRLDNEAWRRDCGKGVHLCGTEVYASSWGRFILACKMKEDASILWHTAGCDIEIEPSELIYCISEPDFWEDLPLSTFKKNVIVAIYNYLIDNCYEGKRAFEKGRLRSFQKHFFQVYKHLQYHGFDGVGFTGEEGPEILVFDPNDVHPVSAHRWNYKKKNNSPPLSLSELKAIQEEAEIEWCRE